MIVDKIKKIINNAYITSASYYPKTPYTGPLPINTVKKGSRGNDVLAVQKFLNWCINAKLSQDSYCGKYTKSAIVRWQKLYKSYGLAADGVFGAKSREVAKKLVSKYAVKNPPVPTDTIVDRILIACETQAEYMKNSKYAWEKDPTIEKSKKKGTCVTYEACVLQRVGLLISGKYIWHDNKGRVIGANDNFIIIYPNNKVLKDLKNELKAGDVVMVGSKSDVGSGSHIFTFTGKWDGNRPIIWDNHSAQQHKGAYAYSGSKKVIAIVRPK